MTHDPRSSDPRSSEDWSGPSPPHATGEWPKAGAGFPTDPYARFRARMVAAARELAGPWGKDAADLLLFVPDLLILFAGIARDSRVPLRHKAVATAVMAYVLSPVDLLPEFLLGPLGFADDLVMAFMALDLFLNRVDPGIVRQHWRGEGDLLSFAQSGLRRARLLVPPRLDRRIARWLGEKEHPTARHGG